MTASPRVVFVDTSVLTCLLNVPGKNQERERVSSGDAPWIPNELTWDPAMITRLRNADAPGDDLVERLQQKIGAGDCMILAERQDYAERSMIDLADIRVWTLDEGLSARA